MGPGPRLRALAARSWRPAAALVVVLDALDLTTSLLPTFIDDQPLAARSGAVLALQLALLVPLARAAIVSLPRLARGWWRLPIPLVPRTIVTACAVMQLGHVALRMEMYPFTCIAMFSSVAVAPADGSYASGSYVIDDGDGIEVVRMLREGNPLFARHCHWDYKAAWVMRMYKGTPGADAVLADELAAPPRFTTVTYGQRDGHIRSVVNRR
jgi:hypothetical protein